MMLGSSVFFFYLLSHSFRTYAWQGGAGTWSDGKLVTRIGRNSGSVQAVRLLHPCKSISFLILVS